MVIRLALGNLDQFSSLRAGNLSILFGVVHYLRFLLLSIGLKALCARECVAVRLIISTDVMINDDQFSSAGSTIMINDERFSEVRVFSKCKY